MAFLEAMDAADLEELIIAVGKRHGFVIPDYSLTWDRGHFDPARFVHEVTIVTADGLSAKANISHAILGNGDPWKHISDIDEAFRSLALRAIE
jgi:hypothetical protein